MKLYGNPGSTCTRKVLTTFAEKGASFEMVTIDLGKAEHKGAEHVARQPFGQIPVLDDGDFRLYESRAIIRYLDQVLPGTSLTPSDPKDRARMEQWISIETSNFTPHAMAFVYQFLLFPQRGLPTDPAKVEEARTKIAPAVQVLDKALADGRTYLVGDQFTLADICYLPYIEYVLLTPAADALTSAKHFTAWAERARGRASWKKATGKA